MDLVGPLPISQGNAYIIVFICAMTKWIEAFPIRTPDAEDAARAFFKGVMLRHGCCRTLVTDRGTNFTSLLFSELCKLLQVDKIHTTAFHPEGNGLVERANGTIVKGLALLINEEQDDWSELLPMILFSYHTSYHRSIGMTPYEAMFGRNAITPRDLEHYKTPKPSSTRNNNAIEQIQKYRELLEKMQQRAKDMNLKAQEDRKERHDAKATNKRFRPDDEVLLKVFQYKRGTCPKLSDKFMGPYTVITQVTKVNYLIQDNATKKQQTVHVNRMKFLPANEKRTIEESEQLELSEEQYEEMFGDSRMETFHGFQEEEEEEEEEEREESPVYVTYLIA